MVKYFFGIALLGLLLFSGCLSLKINLLLPDKKGQRAKLELEYRLSESLQNISNYPAPRDDIAPMPLPLWEWDFRAIAASSPSIELEHYSFIPAQKAKHNRKAKPGLVRATLSFASASDLRLLLGPELNWENQRFSWQLSAANIGPADASYPQLDASLNSEEITLLQQLFTGETLELTVSRGSVVKTQQLKLADFLTGKQNINLEIAQE